MNPNDDNGKLPTSQRPFRVLIIAGSDRRQYNCPGVDSKARALMLRMAERLPQEWEIDYEDLGMCTRGKEYKAAMPASPLRWRSVFGLATVMSRIIVQSLT